MSKNYIIFLVIIFPLLSSCSTVRSLQSARERVAELERLNEAGGIRNTELAKLLESERVGNEELERVLAEKRYELEKYLETERQRIAAERKLAERISGIFEEGTDIVESLIRGLDAIRTYLEAQGILVENIDSSSDISVPDSGS